MRQATLIIGLETRIVYCGQDVRYYTTGPLDYPLMASDGEISTEKMTVPEKIVPITQFCRPGKPDVYIAYSEEVEELLGVPIRCILKENDAAIAQAAALRSMTAWQHIKVAWRLIMKSGPAGSGGDGR